jgi:hypothetical protein
MIIKPPPNPEYPWIIALINEIPTLRNKALVRTSLKTSSIWKYL